MKKSNLLTLFACCITLCAASLSISCTNEDVYFETEEDYDIEESVRADDGDNFAALSDLNKAYADFVEEVMAEEQIPGAAVAIIRGDGTTMAQGFGLRDIDADLPVTADTLFHIGSTNKSLTALAIAALVDDGVLDWDTPIVEIYPTFELAEATDKVTFRHLLSMQGGIPDTAEYDFDIENSTAEDLIDYVAEIDPLGRPGDEFSYSNISSAVSGYVGGFAYLQSEQSDQSDEDADTLDLNQAYNQLLQDLVLDPIGMETAVINRSDAEQSQHYGKSYSLQRGDLVVADQQDFDGDALAPSGILKANVAEMALYISTQLNRGVAPNGNQVVSEENIREMWQPYLENYAMGWYVSNVGGVELISHEGAFDNYLSVIGFVPALDLGFVILTNSEDTGERLIDEGPLFLIDYVQNQE